MKDKGELNCPNCGAPVTGDVCEYCGSVFYDWALFDNHRPTYVKFKYDGKILIAKVKMTNISVRMETDSTAWRYYADNYPFVDSVRQTGHIDASFIMVEEDYKEGKNLLCVVVEDK